MLDIYGSLVIFVVCFIFFVYGKIHRAVVAMLGAAAMIIFGINRGFYTQDMAIGAIGFNTIGLLLGMMIIVGILKRSGLFRYLAIKGIRLSGGDPWKLLIILGLITAFMSMIIDNVTTVLLISPLILLISDILAINPLPILIGTAFLSNVGGVATVVGDPPNVMIGSASGLTFNAFIVHLLPISLLAMGVSLITFKFIFGSRLKKKEKKESQRIQMREREIIKDRGLLFKCLFVLVGVIVLFTTEEIHHFKLAFSAILGAAFALILVRPEPREILSDIEWPVLIFFAALYTMVGGIEEAGTLRILGNSLRGVSSNLLVLSVILVWTSFVFSAFVDNIPYTAAMIPVVQHLGKVGLNVEPLWWALAIGAGFGGNGTPIGSSAGVIVMGLTEKTKYSISFKLWFKSAGIVALLTVIVSTLILVFGFGWYT